MNKLLAKVLTGLSATICGLALSGLFVTPVHAAFNPAAETSGSFPIITVYDDASAGGNDSTGAATGTIYWSYTGTTVEHDHPVAMIDWFDDSNAIFMVYIDFHADATGAAGTADYDFTYMGTAFSGTLPLDYHSYVDGDYSAYYISGSTFIYGSAEDYYNRYTVWFFDEDEESPMSQEIASEINDIKLASNGLNPDGSVSADKTITIEGKGALNSNVIKTLANADGVTVNYTYEYQGYRFMSTITSEGAAKIFSEDIAWYGPCFLANNFPTAMIGVVE